MFVADPSKPPVDVFMYTLHPTRADMLTKGSTDAEKALAAKHWMHSIELLKKGVIMFAGRSSTRAPNRTRPWSFARNRRRKRTRS